MIRHRSFARSRAIVHSIGWRASPSLQRAALSRRSAAASLRYCRNFTLGMNGGMPPSSFDGAGSLIVLITGTGKPSRSSGFSSPWNCRAARPHASWTALMWPAGWSQKMPTVVMNGGSARTIGATFSGVMKRGVFSTKMNPSASAPASTAMSASSRLVMPQIFTRGIIEWVGRDAPPISPPARVVTGHYVLLAPRCAPGGATLRSRVLLAWRPSAVHQCQFAALRGDVVGADEAFADEDCVGAGGGDLMDVGRAEEAALADHDRPERNQRQELERGGDARLERGEVAVVDPDDAAANGQRLIDLGRGVALDERGEPEPLRRREQLGESRRLQDRDDEEHGVGTGRARLPELVFVDREVLAQERHVDRRAHAAQILEAPLEVLLVGEDRDRVGAVRRVRSRQCDRVETA